MCCAVNSKEIFNLKLGDKVPKCHSDYTFPECTVNRVEDYKQPVKSENAKNNEDRSITVRHIHTAAPLFKEVTERSDADRVRQMSEPDWLTFKTSFSTGMYHISNT